MLQTLKGEEGDLFLFGADDAEVVRIAGRFKDEPAGARPIIRGKSGPSAGWWISPMFGKDEKGRIFSMNHPFTSPKEADLPLLGHQPHEGQIEGL